MTTIRDKLPDLPHFQDAGLDPEILDLDIESGCGRDVLFVLTIGNALAGYCAEYRVNIVQAVVAQVRVFYFG